MGHLDPRSDSNTMRVMAESFGVARANRLLEKFTSVAAGQVSSTAVREALLRGESPQELPARVAWIIQRYGLYNKEGVSAGSFENGRTK
jgi:hypothetical protein